MTLVSNRLATRWRLQGGVRCDVKWERRCYRERAWRVVMAGSVGAGREARCRALSWRPWGVTSDVAKLLRKRQLRTQLEEFQVWRWLTSLGHLSAAPFVCLFSCFFVWVTLVWHSITVTEYGYHCQIPKPYHGMPTMFYSICHNETVKNYLKNISIIISWNEIR